MCLELSHVVKVVSHLQRANVIFWLLRDSASKSSSDLTACIHDMPKCLQCGMRG